jgi:predicted MPP superfamily phosphohydrolase
MMLAKPGATDRWPRTKGKEAMNRRTFLKWAAGATLGVPLAGLGYASLEPYWIRVTRLTVALPRLPAAFVGKTVALLTDPHHGPFNSLPFIRSIVDRTNALAPDLIALGGDFIHGHGRPFIKPCLQALGQLRAPLGVFAVAGNHDHWHGVQAVRHAIRDNGIVDVTNVGHWIQLGGSRLRIGGVDDFWEGTQDLDSALGDAADDDACLLLCHNPDYVETLTDPRVGLVLSGHMHGGQIVIPGVGPCIPSRYGLKYLQGLVRTRYTQVFVSRGLGTVAAPLRFRARPEINLLILASQDQGRP